MSVIPLTVFFSLGLAFFFVVLFLREQRRRLFASAERDSLLPLAAEQPRMVGADSPGAAAPATRCGCADGERPPCPNCAHRAGRPGQ